MIELTKLFARSNFPLDGRISVEQLDRVLDVETDRFESQSLWLTKAMARRRALVDVHGYRESRRELAANLTTAANPTEIERVHAGFAAEVRRIAPMDREEEFKMARRHEFFQRQLTWHLAGFGIGEAEARELLRRPMAELRRSLAGRRSRRRLDAAWFDRLLGSFEDLRNLYVEGSLYIVNTVAQRYRGLGVDTADLIQEGGASLFQAIDGFDWRRDVRFRTYAQYWVQQAVLKMLYNHSRTVRVPIWVQKVLGKIRKVQAASRREGRELAYEEIAERLELPVEKVKWVLETRRFAVSLDAEVGDEEGTSLLQRMPDESLEPVPDLVSPGNLGEVLDRAMADLPERERHILRRRFGLGGAEPETLGDIAAEYGVTPERVRQLQNAALQRLQRPGKRKLLEAFVE